MMSRNVLTVITKCTEQSESHNYHKGPRRDRKGAVMEEKTYKLMGTTGGVNILFGILSIALGTAAGVILIIGGAKLLSTRKKILF